MARKVDAEARRRYSEDQEHAERLPGLLERVAAAERALGAAHRSGAGIEELHLLSTALDTALTDAMRAAYARERVLIGPRGADRIYRRKRQATPGIRRATELAERLLSAREEHRLQGIERVPRRVAAA
ncbi:hypothetical protein ACFOVU_08145 [Nocardiopsis sediminis]|uniref:Uncharacterized protein n=1 Tax=Nocardiopsis sediminis TaxID=1778267 RepID=A0ABV8FML0_9ACTN